MTDLELMQLLEDEGYEATAENLEILKEGLERGEYMIKDATEDREPSELTSDIDNEDVYDDEEHEQTEDVGEVVVESFSDYELYQLLEMEGYETTNENLEILKEGLYSGEIEILDEASTSLKRATKEMDNIDGLGEKSKKYVGGKINGYLRSVERKGKTPDGQEIAKIVNNTAKKLSKVSPYI